MSLLQTFAKSGFAKSFAFARIREGAMALGGLAVAHGVAHGYSAEQIGGAVFCIGSILFGMADNYVVDGKISDALNTPVPPQGG